MFIGELAAETGVDPKTIRFYEREGLLSSPRHAMGDSGHIWLPMSVASKMS
ncbi:MAG: MerR family DNA-binding transcriptional regulator [Hyphomicrobiales bacterium]|nr:MerR family DNA-binding transcriptional regulator [Hyphomicrobiales bacterium]